jgi:hypothetical protein
MKHILAASTDGLCPNVMFLLPQRTGIFPSRLKRMEEEDDMLGRGAAHWKRLERRAGSTTLTTGTCASPRGQARGNLHLWPLEGASHLA